MWWWTRKKERAIIDQMVKNVAELTDTVQKVLQDQRSLRGLVNKKLGYRLKDEYEQNEDKTDYMTKEMDDWYKTTVEYNEYMKGQKPFKQETLDY